MHVTVTTNLLASGRGSIPISEIRAWLDTLPRKAEVTGWGSGFQATWTENR